MKPIISKIILFVVGIFVALFLAELVIRSLRLSPLVFDTNIIYGEQFVENPKICYKIKPFAFPDINSEGWKGRDFSLKKDKDLVRIIMLGDSITSGAYVEWYQAFPEALETMLNAKSQLSLSPKRYEVMNFGVCGYNIVSEVEVLRVYGLKYKPDIVVLNYFFNDNELYSFDYWTFLQKKDRSLAEKNWAYQYYLCPHRSFRWKRLFFHSQLFVSTWALVNQIRESWLDFKNVEHETYKNNIVLDELTELKKMGTDHNFKILICMHPILNYDKKETHLNYAKTKRTAERLGLPCVDMLTYYKQQSNDPKPFLLNEKDIAHPNAAGHQLIARSLLSELVKIGYIRFKN